MTVRGYHYDCAKRLYIGPTAIAVRDPGNPGHFLLGIECDGASYHSAKSARDRDRLRQDIVEGLGWKIKRIWSTDWFSNPQAQLAPILKELNELKTVVSLVESNNLDESIECEVEMPKLQVIESTEITETKLSLRELLQNFYTQIIVHAIPDTPEDERLLRPSMLEALLHHKPTSKSEFFEIIPSYLRTGTNVKEGKYLEEILEIIASYG